MFLTVEALVEAQAIIDNLQRKGEELPEKLKELVSEVSFIYQACIMDEAPVITHNLQGATQIENIDDFTTRIYPDEGIAPYAQFVIPGTAPHEIYPVIAEALFWPGAAHPVKKVNHPGTAPNDYFERGASNAQSQAQTEIENFMNWLTGE